MPRMEQKALFQLTAALSLVTSTVVAGHFDAPTNYYDTANGSGAVLKSQLHNIIDDHTVFSYNAARSLLQITDRDPNAPDNIILVYERVSLDVSDLISSPGIPGWDSGVSWNREHTWPRSREVNSSGADHSDLHQLRPVNRSVNSSRNNLNFGGAFGQTFGRINDGGNEVWYPGDEDAGMIARQEFYMDIRYDGSDSSTEDLALLIGDPAAQAPNLGDLNRLLEWHYAAPPEDFELRRNDIIYADYQGNRNPFVDRPEYAWSAFVDQSNDSQIAFQGAEVGSGGESSKTVDLGRVLIGAAVPTSQSVTLDKLGNDGTYYSVTTSGEATSTLSGRYNAFNTGGSDSTTFEVGLNTITATAGQRNGTVTVDNLDVTASGGNGHGDNDGDDVLSVSLDVLDHALPSFASNAGQSFLAFDFGSVAVDAYATFDFDLFNFEQTAAFTAGLDLDAIIGSGDTSLLSTDLATFADLEAGLGTGFTATFDTSSAGTFAATYTLSFSDEDLAGAIDLDDLTLMLIGEVVASTEDADFDQDGDVDGADFLTWQQGFGFGTLPSEGDANGSGTVDAADLAIWEQQQVALAAGSLAQVPEPSSLCMAGTALLAFLTYRRRYRLA